MSYSRKPPYDRICVVERKPGIHRSTDWSGVPEKLSVIGVSILLLPRPTVRIHDLRIDTTLKMIGNVAIKRSLITALVCGETGFDLVGLSGPIPKKSVWRCI